MRRYTIYCTEEQTKKAFELGAPIETWGFARELVIPTAEQMLGWIEEKGFGFETIACVTFRITPFIGDLYLRQVCENSFPEAIRAAIDVVLEYLEKNK